MNIVLHDYGGYAFIFDLACFLAKNGDNVIYIYSALEAPKSEFKKFEGGEGALTVIPLSIGMATSKRNWLQRRRHERLYGKALAKLIVRTPVDAVILTNTPLDVLAEVQPVLAKQSIKFINWLQDIRGLATYRILRKRLPILGSLIGRYYLTLEKRFVRDTAAIIVPSADFLKDMEKFGYNLPPSYVLSNWMPVESLTPMPKDNAWSRKMGIAETTNVCYFGTFGHKQDLGTFLAISRLLESDPNARLVITAEGPAAQNFEAKLRTSGFKNVILLPWQDHAWYAQMLASADILLSVTTADAAAFSIPSKILGYLCAERPVLAIIPSYNLAARILNEEEMGLIVEPHDESGLCSALTRLLCDAKLRERLSQNARVYAKTNFGISKNGRAFRHIIQVQIGKVLE